MIILLPLDCANEDESRLVELANVKSWAQIKVEDGKLQSIKFAEQKEDFSDFSECIVVTNDNEYVWPFMELSMMVLVAHTQRSIEDIVEAYLFKELHDLAY
jgi:hypothetical protein